MTRENPLSADESDFDIQCVRAGVDSYHEAVRTRGRAVSRLNSIARCDNRVSAYDPDEYSSDHIRTTGADADTDGEGHVAAHGNEHDDPVLLPSDAAAEQNAVLAPKSNADTYAGAAPATATDTGAVPSTGQRWSLAAGLLHSVKPDTDEGG